MKYNFTKSEILFVRFGGLSSVSQKGYGGNGFHSPPARRGIYAFVFPFIVPFLLGGKSIGDRHCKHQWKRDKKGNLVEYVNNEGYEHNYMRKFSVVSKFKFDKREFWYHPIKPKKFKYRGLIWHHLGDNLKPFQILKTKNSWVLTTYENWYIAFKKEMFIGYATQKDIFKEVSNNPFKGIGKDHLEVFIEKI